MIIILIIIIKIMILNIFFPFLQKQSKYPVVRKEGCLFCAACFLGGLNNINEVDEFYELAIKYGKV